MFAAGVPVRVFYTRNLEDGNMREKVRKTKVHRGYAELVRQDLEDYLAQVEGKELTDKELKSAMKTFTDRFESLSARVSSGAAITRSIQTVTEPEIQDTGKITEIRFGDVPLASQMIMVAFD
jgi:hypothetical protein